MRAVTRCILGLWMIMTVSYAAMSPPVTLLNNLSQTVLKDLQKNREVYRKNHTKLVSMVEKELMPHVAIDSLSQSVLGRHYWAEASVAQRRAFTALFVKMVVSVYAHALTSYQEQDVQFLPIRGYQPGQATAQVHSLLKPKEARSPVRVVYQLIKQQGEWKILDFGVDGISLARNYQAQFAKTLSEEGIDVLLTKMKARAHS